MPPGTLIALRVRILRALAPLTPRFTPDAGGALAGFHTEHRTTRDLDLFWRERRELGELVAQVEEQLRALGFEVATLRAAQSFHRFEVRGAGETYILDLVADPTQVVDPPEIDGSRTSSSPSRVGISCS